MTAYINISHRRSRYDMTTIIQINMTIYGQKVECGSMNFKIEVNLRGSSVGVEGR